MISDLCGARVRWVFGGSDEHREIRGEGIVRGVYPSVDATKVARVLVEITALTGAKDGGFEVGDLADLNVMCVNIVRPERRRAPVIGSVVRRPGGEP